MSSIASASDLRQLINTTGRAGVNALFPNDFEYYVITLELTDSQGKTIDFLLFPVSPEKIVYDSQSVVQIRKTMGGVNVLDNESFVPKKITLSGTFGRSFKLLIGHPNPTSDSVEAGAFNKITSGFSIRSNIMNSRLKTGYGATKILDAIIEKSSMLDQYNKPVKLYLYNPALGHNFLVKKRHLQMNQDYASSNMMWRYNLVLECVADVNTLSQEENKSTSLIKLTASSLLQRTGNVLANTIKRAL